MAVPKRKTSKARRDKRRTHQVESVKSFTNCLNCQAPLATHTVCSGCGFYKGVKVLATKVERAVRREEQRKARAERQGTATAPQEAQKQVIEAQAEAIAAEAKEAKTKKAAPKKAAAKTEETKKAAPKKTTAKKESSDK